MLPNNREHVNGFYICLIFKKGVIRNGYKRESDVKRHIGLSQ